MVKQSPNTGINISPLGIVYAIFLGGLLIIAYSLVMQRWTIFLGITFFPLVLLILLYAIEKPMLSYIILCTATCYFAAINRYSSITGLSVILDILLVFCFFSIFINVISNRQSYPWINGFNLLFITYFIWICYSAISLLAPYTDIHDPIANRGVFLSVPLLYFISGVLLCTTKKLKIALFLLGIFVITNALKLYWQKYGGWDSGESAWLLDGAWKTHILHTGIRYFSLYSDAGNFGSSMGMFVTAFGIISTVVHNRKFRLFCIGVAVLAGIGMLMSGTRGAIVVPFGGLILYLLISKNLKKIISFALLGSLSFCFFYFTDIGDDNNYIRRMRTAFRPSDDASFLVRLENQKRFREYLDSKPFGLGVGGKILDVEETEFAKEDKYIPTDSMYVEIWLENGIIGLCLYIGIQISILLHCCYLLMFKIKNDQLRQILAALLCSVFGIWLNGYVGRGMGMQPSLLIIAIFLSFVLNGLYMDKSIKKEDTFI